MRIRHIHTLLIASGLVLVTSLAMSQMVKADQTPLPYDSRECAGVRQAVAINVQFVAEADKGRNWVDGPEAAILADIEAQTANIRARVPYCWVTDRSDR